MRLLSSHVLEKGLPEVTKLTIAKDPEVLLVSTVGVAGPDDGFALVDPVHLTGLWVQVHADGEVELLYGEGARYASRVQLVDGLVEGVDE